ncbi:MAG TPA: ABC transporter ATP-binding protein [Methylomirabilota bacterium]|nr:ABC transporter ATP-binding protein [Methylomirabilota bacterium]
MARIELEAVSKRYGDFHAVRNFSLTIEQGELVVLLGPSGCGKTTTLRMIAGFVPVTSGRIRLGGRDVTGLPPHRRNTGLVFQGYALFPHLTAAENIAFGLEMRGLPEAVVREKVASALRLVRLDDLGDRLPRQLSGGQQQRVALARALVIEPDALLLDEPLSNLDAKLREEVRVEIRQLQRALGLTTVMVTHDQDEALAMADRLVVMSAGAIQQIGTQRELYEHPSNRFVAGFVGRTNFLSGQLVEPGVFRSDGGLTLRYDGRSAASSGGAAAARSSGARRALALRPERLVLGGSVDHARANRVAGTVEFASYLGATIEYYVRLSSGETLRVHAPNTGAAGDRAWALGEAVHVSWPAEVGLVLEDDHHPEEDQR